MSQLKGTWRLVRLALRRDRVKLPIALISVGSLMPLLVAAIEDLLISEELGTQQLMVFLSSNPAVRLFGLPTGGEMGDLIMLRAFTFMALIVALISTFTVIRHTRQNEEMGRSELIGANVVGRYAGLTSAIIVALGINIILGVLVYFGLQTGDFPTEGAIAMAVALGAVGVAFSLIAAVCAQLTLTSRSANSLSAAAVGGSFLLSGLGSVLGEAKLNGFEYEPLWTTWFSPFGWGQLMKPFAGNDWSYMLVFGGFFLACLVVSYWLTNRRDVGRGIFDARSGRSEAKQSLLSVSGLTWRQNRTVFFGWLVSMCLLGGIYGSVAGSVEELVSQAEGVAQIFISATGSDEILLAFLGVVMGIMGVLTLAYAVQVTLRLKAEENRALEILMSTSTSRYTLLAAHIAFVLISTTIILLGAGLSAGLVTNYVVETDVGMWPVVAGGLIQLPAIMLVVGLITAMFGLASKLVNPVAWGLLSISVVFSPLFSALLKVPDWLVELSPFTHTPVVPPTDNFDIVPVIVMLVIAAGGVGFGLIAFRRRSLQLQQ